MDRSRGGACGSDRVGMVSLVVVVFFLAMMLASFAGLIAKDWSKERGVSYANPSFLAGAENLEAEAMAAEAGGAKAPPVDLSDIDPLAPRYKEWEERAAKIAVTETKRAETLPFGGDKWGRDVLQKAIKGSEVSIFVGLSAALLATFIGTVLGAMAGYWGGRVNDVLEWFYNIFTSIPYILLILAFAAVAQASGKFGKGILPIVLILSLTGWTGIYRLMRAEYIKHCNREYVKAAQAIGASQRLAHVPPHPAQREPRGRWCSSRSTWCGFIKAEVILSFLGLRRAGRHGLVGHDARRGAERARDRQVVAARRRRREHGDPRHRVLAAHRQPARRAGSEAQMTATRHPARSRSRTCDIALPPRPQVGAVPARSRASPSTSRRNTTVALVGESGSGKSVSAMAILGLLPENAIIAPREPHPLRRRATCCKAPLRGAAVDPRQGHLGDLPGADDVAEPGVHRGRADRRGAAPAHGHEPRAGAARAVELLNEVGIPNPQLRVEFATRTRCPAASSSA